MRFLRAHGPYYTSIDVPEDESIVPSFIEATGDQLYMRLHGKNRDNWFKHNITPTERNKYLYSERELRSVATNLRKLDQRGVKRAYVIFNNCYQNFGIMNAGTMEVILRRRAVEEHRSLNPVSLRRRRSTASSRYHSAA